MADLWFWTLSDQFVMMDPFGVFAILDPRGRLMILDPSARAFNWNIYGRFAIWTQLTAL